MSQRRDRLADELGSFVRQYQRPKGHGEPNDRRYSRDVQGRVRRMDPREFDEIMRGESDDDDVIDVWGYGGDPLDADVGDDEFSLDATDGDEDGDGRSLT